MSLTTPSFVLVGLPVASVSHVGQKDISLLQDSTGKGEGDKERPEDENVS